MIFQFDIILKVIVDFLSPNEAVVSEALIFIHFDIIFSKRFDTIDKT